MRRAEAPIRRQRIEPHLSNLSFILFKINNQITFLSQTTNKNEVVVESSRRAHQKAADRITSLKFITMEFYYSKEEST